MGRAEKTRSGARGDFFGSAAFFSCFRASSSCPSRSVTWRPNRAFIFGGLMKSPPVGCRRCGRRAGASDPAALGGCGRGADQRTGRFTCGERAIELQDNLPGEGEQFTRMAPTVDLRERPDAWIERCKPNHPGSR
ncbi:hypothetical protein ACC699_20415 [Rhizobium ruizarguesonis]|uniref:hypothetical protein n=1 Tax=Rhizobium ruizarguesonis TaxID=2081791 RepID=UPI001FD22433|nr:hypothetical protein [Rhizobium ruizarguesonis]